MIRLRELIERALRHRWLGPVVLLLLAVLLAAVLIHEGGERLADGVGELCLALFVLAAVCVLGPAAQSRARAAAANAQPWRQAPLHSEAARAQPPPRTLPLRL